MTQPTHHVLNAIENETVAAGGWSQSKTRGVVGVNDQAEVLLDLRGNLPYPRRIDASELHKLTRVEARTTDPHDPGKEMDPGPQNPEVTGM